MLPLDIINNVNSVLYKNKIPENLQSAGSSNGSQLPIECAISIKGKYFIKQQHLQHLCHISSPISVNVTKHYITCKYVAISKNKHHNRRHHNYTNYKNRHCERGKAFEGKRNMVLNQ